MCDGNENVIYPETECEELILVHSCKDIKGLTGSRINWTLKTKDHRFLYHGHREGLLDYLELHKDKIKSILDLTDLSIRHIYKRMGIKEVE